MTVEAEAGVGVDLADAVADEEFDLVDAVPLARLAVGRLSHAHIPHLPDQDTLARAPDLDPDADPDPDHSDLDPDPDRIRDILAVQDHLYVPTVNPTIGTIKKSRGKWKNEE